MASKTDESSYAEPEYAKAGKKPSDYPWYLPNIDRHNLPDTQDMLKNYSGIPLAEQSEHVHRIRDEAFAVRTYPCTGLGVFLCPYIYLSPAYNSVLNRMKAGGTLMDVGCFLGMDLRRLVYDEAPSDKMYAVDIVSHWDIGYRLFHDKDKFHATFIESDFLVADRPELNALFGRVDVVSVSAVLHQWQRNKQLEDAKRLAQFTSGPGAMILGYQIGNTQSQEMVMKGTAVPVWRHDPESFALMWDQVGQDTGTKWQTKAELRWWADLGWDPKDYEWMDTGDRPLDFVVTRIE